MYSTLGKYKHAKILDFYPLFTANAQDFTILLVNRRVSIHENLITDFQILNEPR
jgi:hypothetical protein